MTRLRGHVAERDAELGAARVEQARLARALEEANDRSNELSERLRSATAALERLAKERADLAAALAEARARLELRDAEGAPPAPTEAPPPDAGVPAPAATVPGPVAIVHD